MTDHTCMSFAGDPAVEAFGLGAAALRYQAMGLAVLGLAEADKRPHPVYGPVGGVHWSTADNAVVPWLWGRHRAAGVGIATGSKSQLLVIDLDTKAGVNGPASFTRQVGAWPAPSLGYPVVSTPSGGWHLYLRIPDGWRIPTRIGLLPGVDVKAEDGYVAAPPTRVWTAGMVRSDGSSGSVLLPYRWAQGCPCTIPAAPMWLMEWILSAPSRGEQQPGAYNGRELNIGELLERGLPAGERNVTLHRMACSLFRRYGTTPAGAGVVRWHTDMALSRTDRRGFSQAEAERTIASARAFIAAEEAADRREWEDWMNRR